MLFPQPVPASMVPSRTSRANDTTQPPHPCGEYELGQKLTLMSIGKRSRYLPLWSLLRCKKHVYVLICPEPRHVDVEIMVRVLDDGDAQALA